MRMIRPFTIVSLAGALASLLLTVPHAEAAPKDKPKISTPGQVRAAMLDAAALTAVTAHTGTLAPLASNGCDRYQRAPFCTDQYNSNDVGSHFPYYLTVIAFPNARAAKAYVAQVQAGQGQVLASRSPTRAVVVMDTAPTSDATKNFPDAVQIFQTSGRFIISGGCALDNAQNNIGALSDCAQKVNDAQIKKLKNFS